MASATTATPNPKIKPKCFLKNMSEPNLEFFRILGWDQTAFMLRQTNYFRIKRRQLLSSTFYILREILPTLWELHFCTILYTKELTKAKKMARRSFFSLSRPNAPFQCIFYVNGLVFHHFIPSITEANQRQFIALERIRCLDQGRGFPVKCLG